MKEQQFRIAFLWLLIAVGYILHSVYHLSDLFFGIDIQLDDAEGKVPLGKHLFRIALEVVTYCMVLASFYTIKKWFYWFGFVWSFVLGVMNIVHLGGTIAHESSNYSQIALLGFIVMVNVLLAVEIWKIIKRLNYGAAN